MIRGKTGEIIKACRESAGMTQADLAKRVCMARSTLAQYEAGIHEPTHDRMVELLDVCGFEIVVQKKRVKW